MRHHPQKKFGKIPISMKTGPIQKTKKPGRPAFPVTPEVLEKVERLSSLGLNNDQLAAMLGCSRSTFYKAQENPEFARAILKGKTRGILEVSNALFENALEGSVAAQIFFLKNRDPDQWNQETRRVRMEVEVTKMSDSQLLTELSQEPELLKSLRQLELIQENQ